MINLPTPPYSYETNKTSASTNWKPGLGNGRKIESITIHHWGASMSLDFDGIVNFLCSPRPANPTSAHYVAQGSDQHGAKKPRVACIVDPDDIAYHAGNWQGNLTSIGIECRPNGTADDMETVAQLIARLRNQYGPLPLKPHSAWTSTECPGDNYRAKLTWLHNRANAILAAAANPTPAKVTVSLSSNPTWVVQGDTLRLTAKSNAVGSVSFQWYAGGKWVNFATKALVNGTAYVDNKPSATVQYRAVVTGGALSGIVKVTVLTRPVIAAKFGL